MGPVLTALREDVCSAKSVESSPSKAMGTPPPPYKATSHADLDFDEAVRVGLAGDGHLMQRMQAGFVRWAFQRHLLF